MHEQVSEKNIQEGLSHHPELVDEWILYSEDKRSGSGFYLTKDATGFYTVGYLGGAGKNQKTYSERIAACAAFIKQELEEIRLLKS